MAAAAAETEVGVADDVEAEAAEEEDEDGGGGGGDDDELDDTVGGVGVGDDGEAAVLLAAVEPEAAEGGAPGEAESSLPAVRAAVAASTAVKSKTLKKPPVASASARSPFSVKKSSCCPGGRTGVVTLRVSPAGETLSAAMRTPLMIIVGITSCSCAGSARLVPTRLSFDPPVSGPLSGVTLRTRGFAEKKNVCGASNCCPFKLKSTALKPEAAARDRAL